MTLLEWFEKNKIKTEDLDDIVHNAASEMASNSNNEGLRGQVEFLTVICGWSEKDIKDIVSP